MKFKIIFLVLFALIFLLNHDKCIGQQNFLVYKDLVHEYFYPNQLIKKSEGHYFIIFEKAYFGKLELRLKSTSGDTIIVKMGEKSTDDQSVDNHPPGTVRYVEDELILEKGENTYLVNIPDFEPPGWAKGKNYDIKLPENIGNLTPFRYAEIIGFDGNLEKDQIRQIAYFYPFDDHASLCETSSEELNQVWDLCKHTIKATTFTGVYIDGDRERRPYEGDAYINQLSHYAVDAEYAITRKTVDHLFKYPTWPTEWKFHMHLILWEDYMYTGNDEYLKLYYPSLKKIVEEVAFNENGLIENVNNEDIIDWPASERDGYKLGKVNNVPNAFYYKSLQIMSRVAGVLNNQADSVYFAGKAEKHKITFNKYFWNDKTKLYIDAVDSLHSSIHANIFPIVFDLASGSQIESIVPFIKSKGMAVSVYGAQYLLDALYLTGEDEYALGLITAAHERSWLNMINQGGTITWEAWNEKVKGNLDWNHAWGAAPGNIIARRIFGIRPLTPGFQKAVIQPQITNIKRGRFVQPTVNGPIEVSFDRKTEPELTLGIKLDMPAELILSQTEYDKDAIMINGLKAKPIIEGDKLIFHISDKVNKIKLKMKY